MVVEEMMDLPGNITASAVWGLGVASFDELIALRLLDADGALAVPALAMEEMLPEIECPRAVAKVLEESDDSVESGRGIYSNVSENPTRVRVGEEACAVVVVLSSFSLEQSSIDGLLGLGKPD